MYMYAHQTAVSHMLQVYDTTQLRAVQSILQVPHFSAGSML